MTVSRRSTARGSISATSAILAQPRHAPLHGGCRQADVGADHFGGASRIALHDREDAAIEFVGFGRHRAQTPRGMEMRANNATSPRGGNRARVVALHGRRFSSPAVVFLIHAASVVDFRPRHSLP
jgi:hypothetical protein